jgi:hypothetical protein
MLGAGSSRMSQIDAANSDQSSRNTITTYNMVSSLGNTKALLLQINSRSLHATSLRNTRGLLLRRGITEDVSAMEL